MPRSNLFLLLLACCVSIGRTDALRAADTAAASVVLPEQSSWAETFAAHEIRRYIYLRTGRLFPISQTPETGTGKRTLILVSRKDRPMLQELPAIAAWSPSLPPQGFGLKTLDQEATSDLPKRWRGHNLVFIIGGDNAGTLYGAYRFAETLGVRFYLHDDVIPDRRVAWKVPVLDEQSEPLFQLRGIQPFHDFPEGPDWWNRDDYLAVIGQLPKLRMNFFGLHTYPEGRPNAEPTVWIGPPSEIGTDGRVNASYPSSYQNSLRGNWGYAPKKTSDYILGASWLFDRDAYGADVMDNCMPAPSTTEACNGLFTRTANVLHEAFSFAQKLGVKTCVGTETPLVIPKQVQERLMAAGKNPADLGTIQELYAGIFLRAAKAYPLDYYWFWTPEGWTWSGTKEEEIRATTNDLFAAVAAHQEIGSPFSLATCGWVLGPQQDRAMFDKVLPKNIAISCINREVGKTPVEPGFADVRGRSKWAIPWMEDDPALTSPQLWVGRMRRDAADALRYGCEGLFGIHWRTRVLAPNVAALAQAAWDQEPWVQSYGRALPSAQSNNVPGPVGGHHAAFPNSPISGTADPALYQTVRYDVAAYHLAASNGLCLVILRFAEPHYGEIGKRVFDVRLQGQTVITNLDIFARVGKNAALDFAFENVAVTNGWLDIDFVPRVEFPSIAAIEVQGSGVATRINCGGPDHGQYRADAPGAEPVKQIYARTDDFYHDWALHEFGQEIAKDAAEIFARVDCRLPVPSVWTDGPGGIQPDPRPWQQVRQDYAFVEDFEALASRVRGQGNLDRYQYWLNTFEYLRTIGELNCEWSEWNRVMDKVRTTKDEKARKQLAQDLAVPARRNLLRLTEVLYHHLLATVSTPGELGTVANWEQHNLPALLTRPGEELSKILEAPLAPDLQPNGAYRGPLRVIVPCKRTAIATGEPLRLRAIILSEQTPRAVNLFYRKMGVGKFARAPFHHLARGVYTIELAWTQNEDLEYYVKAELKTSEAACFPVTAPRINQTVTLYGSN